MAVESESAKGTSPKSSDVVSLEDVMRGLASDEKAAAAAAAAAPPLPAGPAASSAPGAASTHDLGALDSILSQEDPAFNESMAKLRAESAKESHAGDPEIDSIDVTAVLTGDDKPSKHPVLLHLQTLRDLLSRPKQLAGWAARLGAAFATALKSGGKIGFHKSKKTLIAILKSIPAAMGAYGDLPFRSKLAVLTVPLLGVCAVLAIMKSRQGPLLPSLEAVYLRSFAEVADAKYVYDEKEAMDDFHDPLYHPEHVVLFDKLIVNLKHDSPDETPMGYFDLYIEASSHEGAVELKKREVEVRDVMGRTLEQMTYGELVTATGKNKLKIILRRSLNDLLSQGRVRRVYFKNIVVKP